MSEKVSLPSPVVRAFACFDKTLADLDAKTFSPEELALADGALADLASRRDEDPQVWAARLAADAVAQDRR